jgi:uncharacterized protein
VKSVLVDTGFLVALGIERDPRHRAAKAFTDSYVGQMLVPAPVVSEACYFLSSAGKVRLLDWVGRLPRKVIDLPVTLYREAGAIIERYANLDPDFTDAAIVLLAQITGCRAILTVDERDFSVYRQKGGKRLELVKWMT